MEVIRMQRRIDELEDELASVRAEWVAGLDKRADFIDRMEKAEKERDKLRAFWEQDRHERSLQVGDLEKEKNRLRDWACDLEERAEKAETERDKLRAELAEQRKWKEIAYSERAKLVSLLTRLFPSYLAHHDMDDTTWDKEWMTIVFVDLPTGQASWHVHDSDVHLFAHLTVFPNRWDGHTTEEKYQRVLAVRDTSREELELARRVIDAGNAVVATGNVTEWFREVHASYHASFGGRNFTIYSTVPRGAR